MSMDWIPTGATRDIRAKEMGNRGIFPSTKVPGGIVEYESCLERDFFLICHHAPDVVKFQHQPISIRYSDKDLKARKYTPDAYVEFEGGKKGLFEIKYEEEILARGKKYEERWSAAREWGRERNITFSVLTEQNIRTPRWFNTWFTLGSSKCAPSARDIEMLNQVIPENGERYVEICYLLSESAGIEINKSAQILCYAIYHGLVFLDSFSTRQITNDAVIRKRRGKGGLSFKPLWEELPILGGTGDARENNTPLPKEDILETISSRIPVKYEEKVMTKIKVAKSWLSQPKHRRTREWREKFCAEWGVSEKTAYNWAEAYRKDGIDGLVPKHGRAGRRAKYDAMTTELLENSRQHFLAPLGTLKKAYYILEEQCRARKIAVPKFSSFKSYIYKGTSASELARKRGRKYHKAHFTPALASFQGALAPMQVVQMDNTSLDIFPVDSETRRGLAQVWPPRT
jgi:transposase